MMENDNGFILKDSYFSDEELAKIYEFVVAKDRDGATKYIMSIFKRWEEESTGKSVVVDKKDKQK